MSKLHACPERREFHRHHSPPSAYLRSSLRKAESGQPARADAEVGTLSGFVVGSSDKNVAKDIVVDILNKALLVYISGIGMKGLCLSRSGLLSEMFDHGRWQDKTVSITL